MNQCPHCTHTFDSKHGMLTHKGMVHRKIKCLHCSKTFDTYRGMQTHNGMIHETVSSRHQKRKQLRHERYLWDTMQKQRQKEKSDKVFMSQIIDNKQNALTITKCFPKDIPRPIELQKYELFMPIVKHVRLKEIILVDYDRNEYWYGSTAGLAELWGLKEQIKIPSTFNRLSFEELRKVQKRVNKECESDCDNKQCDLKFATGHVRQVKGYNASFEMGTTDYELRIECVINNNKEIVLINVDWENKQMTEKEPPLKKLRKH